ncbi:hypothetical protein EIZ47_06180 [Chryseobacterium lacus]|uniref:hypothetical protein n=1 Tax=Chryseobacterium lacus TaxID=2058346 RepID=UPI000F87B533|nr:hypothetical protein [Chryseobacterium lacus]RST27881.1 hypothetical protein EIZ47_06180 [Chryseobacterium lacus]
MKTLEKLENFKLENEKLKMTRGGSRTLDIGVGGPDTGAGTRTVCDWPSPGWTTVMAFTADYSGPGGILGLNETVLCQEPSVTILP